MLVLAAVALLLIFASIAANNSILKNRQVINPNDFSTNITNKYFSLPVGRKIVYQTKTNEGIEKDEIVITGETKIIDGVNTLVYSDKVWLNNLLVEDARDYLAQHTNGDLWYFGEDVDNYDKGKFVNHSGAWIAGIKGAQPGIWIKENPQVGETYKQEYWAHEAEDTATVLALHETVKLPYGTFTDCLKTYDWTPLNPADMENKYYCPELKTVVLEVDLATKERTEITSIK